jgi:hypothetical protein
MGAEDRHAIDDDVGWIKDILEKNKDKSFVDRILNKDKYPTLDRGNGKFSTHSMEWGSAGDKYVVYPTVLWNGKELKDYGPDAWEQVKKTGNYIEFDTPEGAAHFSSNYKKIWGQE